MGLDGARGGRGYRTNPEPFSRASWANSGKGLAVAMIRQRSRRGHRGVGESGSRGVGESGSRGVAEDRFPPRMFVTAGKEDSPKFLRADAGARPLRPGGHGHVAGDDHGRDSRRLCRIRTSAGGYVASRFHAVTYARRLDKSDNRIATLIINSTAGRDGPSPSPARRIITSPRGLPGGEVDASARAGEGPPAATAPHPSLAGQGADAPEWHVRALGAGGVSRARRAERGGRGDGVRFVRGGVENAESVHHRRSGGARRWGRDSIRGSGSPYRRSV